MCFRALQAKRFCSTSGQGEGPEVAFPGFCVEIAFSLCWQGLGFPAPLKAFSLWRQWTRAGLSPGAARWEANKFHYVAPSTVKIQLEGCANFQMAFSKPSGKKMPRGTMGTRKNCSVNYFWIVNLFSKNVYSHILQWWLSLYGIGDAILIIVKWKYHK